MKKISLKVAACLLAGTFLLSSCFVGKYALWNKYINWQNHMTSMGQDGRYYAVTTLKNGYEVKAPTGEITYFIHDDANDSWSVEQNGVQKELVRFNADGSIQANVNGETRNFTLNEVGVYDARMAANGTFFAMN